MNGNCFDNSIDAAGKMLIDMLRNDASQQPFENGKSARLIISLPFQVDLSTCHDLLQNCKRIIQLVVVSAKQDRVLPAGQVSTGESKIFATCKSFSLKCFSHKGINYNC
jgi:hypothetical protein